jgi:hypothetical protein
MSEYDPLFGPEDAMGDDAVGARDLDEVRERFARVARPYLASPWPWVVWAVVLPATAVLHPQVAIRYGPRGVLLLWSAAVLLGGVVEGVGLLRRRRRAPSTPLVAWLLRAQGNLSLIAVALSAYLLWAGRGEALPGVWLLLVGHSFYVLGGLAFPPFRLYGLAFQVVGAAALWPGAAPLQLFAGVTGAANLWLAWRVARSRG